jgi:TfdA family taurine catabolism dioxygenase TauD
MKSATQTYQHRSASFAWRAASFRNPSDYLLELGPDDREEILAALSTLGRQGRLAPVPLLARGDFRFGGLAARLARAYDEVRSGRGFVVLRGLPFEGLSLEQYTAAVWGLGLHFGQALSQNAQGDLVTSVIDATAEDATPRMYRSNLELRPHSDVTAMISLACWQKSRSGGASVVVSGVTVHDAIRERAPHLLEPLYRGFHYHRLGEEGPGEEATTPYRVPVFANRNGQLCCRYQRSGIAGGHRERGVPLGERDIEALNLFDEVAAAPENRLAFFLERGDMIVINNYTVMHARTRFANFPEPERQRRLVRLWLDAEGFRDVPREFNLFKTNGVPRQEGRRANFDFAKLYRDDPLATGGVPDLKLKDSEAAR